MQSPSRDSRTVLVNGKPFSWDPEHGLDPAAVCELKGYILKRAWSHARLSAQVGVPLEDLAQDAYKASVRAAQRYHPDANASFMTYAKVWIDSAIKKGLRENLIRTPEGQVPTHILRVGPSRADDDQGLDWERLGRVAQTSASQVESAGLEDEVFDHLTLALAALPPEQERVLRMREGLGGGEAMSFQQIAQELGITLQQARRMHRLAYETLGKRLRADRGSRQTQAWLQRRL